MIFYRKSSAQKWLFRTIVGLLLIFVILSGTDFVLGVIYPGRPEARTDLKYYYNAVGTNQVIALTFDDGPDPVRTQKIMDILKRHDVPATFFILGNNALKYPKIVREASEQGFEIGNHTYTHSYDVHQSRERLKLELNLTNKIIENITGTPPVLYRAPFLLDIGVDAVPDPNTPHAALQWAQEEGYIPIGADVDSKDWDAKSSEEVYETFFKNLDDGGHIALLHDGVSGPYTVEALEPIILELKARGYAFTTVSDVIGLHFSERIHISQDLRLGAEDTETLKDVSALQAFLLKEGVFDHEVTGYFGAITANALATWQTQNNVTEEPAYAGPITRAKIMSSLATGTPSYEQVSGFRHFLINDAVQRLYIVSTSIGGTFIASLAGLVIILVAVRFIAILLLLLLSYRKRKGYFRPYQNSVSVIIPAYNEEENIAATIQSIINNGQIIREIIVVNDGSTDRTSEVVQNIREKYPHIIRLFETVNGGKARALSLGVEKAVSDIVVTTDGDSFFDHNAIERLIGHFADSHVGAVAGKVRVTTSKKLLNIFQHLEYYIGQNVDKRAFSVINAISVVPGPIGAWRKADIYAVGGYSTDTLVEDQDLTLAMLAAGRKVIYEPAAFAYTEAPHSIRDFVKQRFRWIFGTFQCTWKYKSSLFNLKNPSLGWITMPHTILFGIFLPLVYPAMDALLVISLALGFWENIVVGYAAFIVLDFAYASLGLIEERKRLLAMLLLPVQRLFYRFVIYFVVAASVIKAIEGTEALWNKVRKNGEAYNLHLQLAALPEKE